jgi:hypothetical protein
VSLRKGSMQQYWLKVVFRALAQAQWLQQPLGVASLLSLSSFVSVIANMCSRTRHLRFDHWLNSNQ